MKKSGKDKPEPGTTANTNKREELSTREIILDGLIHIVEDKNFSHTVIHQQLSKHQGLDKRDRAFISHVIIGTLEHLLEMDYIINQFSSIEVKKMKPVIRNLLRSGVYQLKYMNNIPPSAVCNEAVNIAKKRGFKNLTGFVNGNLRNIARNLEQLSYPTDPWSRLEIQTSIPVWIIKCWSKDEIFADAKGQPDWDKIGKVAEAFLEKRPLTIRTNVSKIEPKLLKEKLEHHGLVVEEHPFLNIAFKISGIDTLEALEDFKAGNFYVQDASSMLVAELANPSGGEAILDLCAAPGGKALHLADKMRYANGLGSEDEASEDEKRNLTTRSQLEAGMVLACDLTHKKVALIEENIARSGFQNIKAIKRDATIFNEGWVEKADLVIADLPCSGLGVLGKKPDLRYNVTSEGIHELVKLQRKILSNAYAYLKPRGTLIMSTCTINAKENIENVRWLLLQFPQLQLRPILEELPDPLRQEIERNRPETQGREMDCHQSKPDDGDPVKDKTLQLLPGINDCDGFFIAKFIKQGRS